MIRRFGNFGIAETGNNELATFSVGAMGNEWLNSSQFMIGKSHQWYEQSMSVGQYKIVPMGYNNLMPVELQQMLDEFYSGEGLLGKIQGLQWGEGPRLYREEYTQEGEIYRQWVYDREIWEFLKSIDFEEKLLRWHVELTHGLGYFYKVFRNRGARIGQPQIANIEPVSVAHARLEFPKVGSDYPDNIIVGDFPNNNYTKLTRYPIWNKSDPFRYSVAMGYQNIYSFAKQFYSTPRFYGAYSWIRLASRIAPLLSSYNKNAAAISYHIESPQSFWDRVEEQLKDKATAEGLTYSFDMLEDAKDKIFEEYTKGITGETKVGGFVHTQSIYSNLAQNFEGWKIIPLDKKIKDFIDAQIAIANKADSAAASGFGLHASLGNMIIDGKMASGSEMLYAMKTYIAAETKIPEMILFNPHNAILDINFPSKGLKLGFYRQIVMKESEVTPSDRIKENV
ncbi:MAG: hypothetical protein LBB41_02310 [Prevotellaceae bacterium]|jgi:hypothetical protein|nr:hypothetical protein [Prevotellaceae bacterium]